MLQSFEGQLDKIRLQKLLLLFTKRQNKPAYDFIPYRFGCYSFSAVADLKAMIRQKILREDENSVAKADNLDYFNQLSHPDQKILTEIRFSYGRMKTDELMRSTYLQYPIYAINSEVAENLLSEIELKAVEIVRPIKKVTVLFTIGYEGISLEEYMLRLINNDVKVLVDVRKNPLSMKFGFSKNQLNKYCESLGIKYMHFPELGIDAELRQELLGQEDYDKLFDLYKQKILPQTTQFQYEVFKLLKQYQRIALTCFEANIHQCHRKHLAEAIAKLPGFTYEVKHI